MSQYAYVIEVSELLPTVQVETRQNKPSYMYREGQQDIAIQSEIILTFYFSLR
jgi:hypothetical protein